ncbi:hypothetical protein JCM3774_000285 [Rhodotorula dairenensis]
MGASPSSASSPALAPGPSHSGQNAISSRPGTSSSSSRPQSITVFCGSSPGTDPVYLEAANELATELAKNQITLIYGGGTKGLMGKIASSALDAGGKVHGIIPAAFLSAEAPDRSANTKPNEVETVVGSMHERKKLMADLSDAFIGLPGGYGTLEEVAEMTTWSQIGVHLKPVILLNVNNFYSSLRDFIHNAVSSGFIGTKQANLLVFVDGPPPCRTTATAATSSSGDTPSASEPRPGPKLGAFNWGRAALAAIADWHAKGAGGAEPYSFEWSEDRKKAEGVL